MLKTPPLQTATATIDTLCGRLQSATLLEDRRGAILGLRSFAKQYPASVASGSLRELINILRRDGLGDAGSSKSSRDGDSRRSAEGGDVDTIRLVLETLLMLFNPDSSSPEAGDEIAYFMADEFSMRQDNITLLLSLLDPTSPYADYYSRLYSVQILSAICAARPDRLQECILSVPLGVSRLVGILDDTRDAVRNAGLLLLVDLTSGANEDLRKIIAFEDVFGKVFALIRAEGGLAEAGITAQDCLSLLANLIKGSASNQTMFRESGCVSQMAQLLQQAFPPTVPEAPFIAQGREKAAWGLLRLLELFLEPGESGTAQNQASFFRAGTGQVLIDLGFSTSLPPPIRSLALRCAAALIASNPPLQEAFAALTVATSSDPADSTLKPSAHTNGSRSATTSARGSARPSIEQPRTYVIEALLDLTLTQAQAATSLRAAACSLVQAYLTNHERIKAHFLQRAMAGHAGQEDSANVLMTLLDAEADVSSVVYASWIVSDLISDQPQAKAALASVNEGNETEGEDVLSFIQAAGSRLQEALQLPEERLVAAYAGLLTVLLWESAEGVDFLLAEGSSLVQALIIAANPASSSSVVAGLAGALLGTVYEFSTKDSPIPRRTLAPLLTQKLGRSKYLEALTQLRRHPAIRDFDIDQSEEDGLFSKSFVDLYLTEYSRLRKAIDKDPGLEVLPPSAAREGVDRDVLDDLRQQLQTLQEAISQAQSESLAAAQQHEQDRMTATKSLQTANAEVERLRRINQAMQQGHESELEKIAVLAKREKEAISAEHQRAVAGVRQEVERQAQTRLQEREAAHAQKTQEYERRLVESGNAHRSEQNGHNETARQLEAITARHAELGTREKEVRAEHEELKRQHGTLVQQHQGLQMQLQQTAAELEQVRGESEKRQELVTRFTSQIKDLREELKAKEEELATERAGFEELEKELEAARSSAKVASESASAEPVASAETAKLEKALSEAKESEKSAREELDSMLLVMGDIEAKRDEYRDKVKELGGEISEEDDEDDDEEAEGAEAEEEDDDDEDVE